MRQPLPPPGRRPAQRRGRGGHARASPEPPPSQVGSRARALSPPREVVARGAQDLSRILNVKGGRKPLWSPLHPPHRVTTGDVSPAWGEMSEDA